MSPGTPPVDDSDEIWDLAAANARAADLLAEGHEKDALPEFERVHERCLALLGPQHPVTLTVAGNLAVTTFAAGRRRPGLALMAENVAARAAVFGDEDPRTLTARDALAVSRRLAGEVDAAVTLSEQVTAQRTRTLGAADPATLTSRMGLVQARAAAGDVEVAAALLTAAIADAEETLGGRHPSTVALLECGEHIGLLHTDW